MKKNEYENVIIRYVRRDLTDNEIKNQPNRELGTPFACIVAINRRQIGISICSHKDQFCKSIGRDIAIGRARKNYVPDDFIPHSWAQKNPDLVTKIWDTIYYVDDLSIEWFDDQGNIIKPKLEKV